MSLREYINVLILKHWTAHTKLGSRSRQRRTQLVYWPV